jgi:hypothetical protein
MYRENEHKNLLFKRILMHHFSFVQILQLNLTYFKLIDKSAFPVHESAV